MEEKDTIGTGGACPRVPHSKEGPFPKFVLLVPHKIIGVGDKKGGVWGAAAPLQFLGKLDNFWANLTIFGQT